LSSKNVECKVCKAKFASALALKQHSVAKNHNAFLCKTCNKSFLSKQALKSHSSAKHPNLQPINKSLKNKKQHSEFNENGILSAEIADLEKKKREIEKEIDDLVNLKSTIIEVESTFNDTELLNEIEEVSIETKNLSSDFDWYKKLGLISNPFPTKSGLLDIDEVYYDSIVLKTPIFTKYLDIVENVPQDLTNKSHIIYGEFGCGKSTLFDYLGYKLLKKNILPLNIILDAQPSLPKIHNSFQESIFNELASHLTDTTCNPSGLFFSKNRDSILELFENVKKFTPYQSFIIFLDGLHKSEDNREIPLKFLIQLQNTLEFFTRKGIRLGIFISGSNDWKENIEYGSKVSGSYDTMDKMPEITPKDAFEMLMMRFESFSEDSTQEINYFSMHAIDILINTIKRRTTSEVSFRIFINEFLNRGIIINNTIQFNFNLEKDILKTISDEMNKNSTFLRTLKTLKQSFSKKPDAYEVLIHIISDIYERRAIKDDDIYVQNNLPYFKILNSNSIAVKKFNKETGALFYQINSPVYQTLNSVEQKVKLLPKYYLNIIFDKKEILEQSEEDEDYLKFVETLTRYKSSSPIYRNQLEFLIEHCNKNYAPFIEKLEKSMKSQQIEFEKEIIHTMDSLLEPLLRFLYEISQEPSKDLSLEALFEVFKYTWLNSNEISYYLREHSKYLRFIPKSRLEKGKFFKSFQDAFESLIWKIGKHLSYNNTLIVGSKDLNDKEKVELNRSRALFYAPQYLQSIRTYSDLLEINLRSFLYNILKIKYGQNWQSLIPPPLMVKITQNRSRDVIHFGKFLTNDNILCYLSRGEYPPLILEGYLWNTSFKYIFGDINKQLIIDLQNISTIANLDKHNREEEDLSEISYLIPQNLEHTRKVLEYINRSYQLLLSPKNIFLNDSSTELCFSFNNTPDDSKNIPINIDQKEVKQLLKNLQFVLNLKGYREKYINLGDQNFIHRTFSFEYRKSIGIIAYLLKKKKIKIIDCLGSEFLFVIL
jgi:C2H2-type zinc finger protein